MTRLNLTNLQTVCTIAQLGTFERAALRLNASQPTITARVRDLEEQFGVQLFQRHGRRMQLTVKGRLLVEQLAPLIEKLEEAASIISAPEAARGVMRIGIGVVTVSWFRELLVSLQHEMPLVRYEIESDMSMNMMAMMREGKLDLAIVAGEVRDPDLRSAQLHPVEFRWVMSRRIPRERDGRALSKEELVRHTPAWFVSRPSAVFSSSYSQLEACGIGPDNINTCGNLSALLQLLLQGAGIGLMAMPLARPWLESGDLVPVSDAFPPEMLKFTLVWHNSQSDATVHRLAQRIIEFDSSRSDTGNLPE